MSANQLLRKADNGISAYSANSASSGVLDSRVDIVSDDIGNPVNVDGLEYRWNGRQLQGIYADENNYIKYSYNTDGQRVKKEFYFAEDEMYSTYEYFYNGEILAGQKVSKTENGETTEYMLAFMYDNNGDAFGFLYNGEPYYYIKNAQNDVVLITDADGGSVVMYMYDAWGRITKCYDGTEDGIGSINPITYRSYYYDMELEMYYLNSRYYVPALCRFLNADEYVSTGNGMLEKNMFTYCVNNPIHYVDPNGTAHMCRTFGFCPVCSLSVSTPSSSAITGPLVALPALPGLPALPEPPVQPGTVDMSRGRGKEPSPRKDPRKGSDERQKSGERERNVGHKNAEEHSRVPKGNGVKIRRMAAIGALAAVSVSVIVLVADDSTGIGVADDVLLPPAIVLWDVAFQAATT